MSPKRQPAQWGKIVEVDGFFLLSSDGKTEKEPHGVCLGLVSDENREAGPLGR